MRRWSVPWLIVGRYVAGPASAASVPRSSTDSLTVTTGTATCHSDSRIAVAGWLGSQELSTKTNCSPCNFVFIKIYIIIIIR